MRIAFVGRVGSGKTTCGAVFSRYLAAQGLPVLALDAGAERRLGKALGLRVPPPPPPAWFEERQAATSQAATSQAATSQAGEPGRLRGQIVDVDPGGELMGLHTAAALDGVRLLTTDAVVPLLDRLADGEREYVVLDLAADVFASGLCTRFDMTVLVTEPTRRDIDAYRQHSEKASGQGVELRVLGNKISDWGDAAWLTEQMGDALVGCVGHSAWVRAAERGTAGPVSGLEPGNTLALAATRSALDACRRALTARAAVGQPRKMQQGDTAATGSQQCHPAEVATAYSASSR